MERDRLRPQAGDLDQDLEEKEGADTFETKSSLENGPSQPGHSEGGTMGDSRPDRISPEDAHFVDADDDPNLHITRRSTETTPVQRDGAEELAKIRHDDSSVYAKPQAPVGEEGGAIGPRKAEGEDS